MHESILLKNVQLCLPEGLREGDLYIKNGKIEAIAPSLSVSAELVIKDRGLVVLPGLIDTHVHFREPGLTHKETIATGSRAAVSGGVTSFFEMPNTIPATTTAELIAEKKEIAARESLANYNFYIGATTENLDDLNAVENVPGIKIYAGSSTGDLLVSDPKDLEHIFKNGSRLIAVHSEDEGIIQENLQRFKDSSDPLDHVKIRSPEAAIKSTQLLVSLSKKYQRRLHILHVTTKEEALYLATEKTPYITAEVCPHHLFLSAPDDYHRLKTLIKMNPPIRGKEHQAALWKGLVAGVFDSIGSDHAPHTLSEKNQAFMTAPAGMPGVENTLPLLLNAVAEKKISLEQLCHWTASSPAKCFNIAKKGAILAGYDGDLAIVDLKGEEDVTAQTSHNVCGWTPFEGFRLKGKVLMTLVNGQVVFREGEFFEDLKGKEVEILRG